MKSIYIQIFFNLLMLVLMMVFGSIAFGCKTTNNTEQEIELNSLETYQPMPNIYPSNLNDSPRRIGK